MWMLVVTQAAQMLEAGVVGEELGGLAREDPNMQV